MIDLRHLATALTLACGSCEFIENDAEELAYAYALESQAIVNAASPDEPADIDIRVRLYPAARSSSIDLVAVRLFESDGMGGHQESSLLQLDVDFPESFDGYLAAETRPILDLENRGTTNSDLAERCNQLLVLELGLQQAGATSPVTSFSRMPVFCPCPD